MQIFWIKLDNLKYKTFLKELLKLDKQNIVFTPNPEILLKTKTDNELKKLLFKADYLIPDWIWLYIAFQIKTSPLTPLLKGEGNIKDFTYFAWNLLLLPYYFFNLFFRRKYLYNKYWDRICGSDLTKDLVEYSEKNNIKITIIDLYNPTDSKKVASQKVFPKLLKQKFSQLDFDYFIYDESKKEEIIKKIWNSESKILFSTLWMRKQEESVVEIIWKCNNLKIWLWIGSSFDYFIWFQKRAPKIWRSIWLEWFYRLITWPRKIDRLKRIYNAIFVFIWEVLKNK